MLKDKIEYQPQNAFIIKCINIKPLPYAEAFWNSSPILYKGKLYALQNISNEYEGDVVYEGKRRILEFDSYEWRVKK